jgi:hypothetical protein
MHEPAFSGLLLVVAVAFAAPLPLGFFPSVQLPAVVLEITTIGLVFLLFSPASRSSSTSSAGAPCAWRAVCVLSDQRSRAHLVAWPHARSPGAQAEHDPGGTSKQE